MWMSRNQNEQRINLNSFASYLLEKNQQFERALHFIEELMALHSAVGESEDKQKKIKSATVAILAIVAKMRKGVNLPSFSADDWEEVANAVQAVALDDDDSRYSVFVFKCLSLALGETLSSLEAVASPSSIASLKETKEELDALILLFADEGISEVKFIEDAQFVCFRGQRRFLRHMPRVCCRRKSTSNWSRHLLLWLSRWRDLRCIRRSSKSFPGWRNTGIG